MPTRQILADHESNMAKAVDFLKNELKSVRTGRAAPGLVENLSVDYYGSPTPLNQVSNVGLSDQRTITIQPWEKSMIEPIEKAIMKANLGFNPSNNGEVIRIAVPALTEERRKDLAKQVRNEGENAKISLRNARRDTNEEIKRLVKEGLSEDAGKKAEESRC